MTGDANGCNRRSLEVRSCVGIQGTTDLKRLRILTGPHLMPQEVIDIRSVDKSKVTPSSVLTGSCKPFFVLTEDHSDMLKDIHHKDLNVRSNHLSADEG